MDSPFILRPVGRAAPPGFPPDVVPNQIITASHINAIRDSVAVWPGNVDGNGKNLSNVATIAATGALTAGQLGSWGDLSVQGIATISGGGYPAAALDLPNINQYIRLGTKGILQGYGGGPYLAHNAVINASAQWVGISNGAASIIECSADRVNVYCNSTVLTGSAFTPVEVLKITSSDVRIGKTLDVTERLRASGNTPPATGQGLEIAFWGGGGHIDSYDRSASAYRELFIDGEGIRLNLNSGGLSVNGLQSADPGAGSKRLWYDPADGNRIKYAA